MVRVPLNEILISLFDLFKALVNSRVECDLAVVCAFGSESAVVADPLVYFGLSFVVGFHDFVELLLDRIGGINDLQLNACRLRHEIADCDHRVGGQHCSEKSEKDFVHGRIIQPVRRTVQPTGKQPLKSRRSEGMVESDEVAGEVSGLRGGSEVLVLRRVFLRVF